MIAATPAEREREQLRTLRAELRPLGVRVRVEARQGRRHYLLTAGERVLFSTPDKLAALSFGLGVVAGHQHASSQGGART